MTSARTADRWYQTPTHRRLTNRRPAAPRPPLSSPRMADVEAMNDLQLVEHFQIDPERAYLVLLERYTPVLLRMIRVFMKDPDEVMEVYTSICERFTANDYQALRRFHSDGELTPWLSVVVANACRDRFRKKKATSVPLSVISQLDDREKLVFKYYYQEHLAHEDIAEIISRRHRVTYTALEVVAAVGKINDLLSTRKRWHLLSALSANRPKLSLDELGETGFQPTDPEGLADFDESLYRQERVERLNDAFHQLEAEDQLLILLRFEQNRTAPQIANIMNYDNHKYVYTRLRTVIGRLRRLMGLEEDGR